MNVVVLLFLSERSQSRRYRTRSRIAVFSHVRYSGLGTSSDGVSKGAYIIVAAAVMPIDDFPPFFPVLRATFFFDFGYFIQHDRWRRRNRRSCSSALAAKYDRLFTFFRFRNCRCLFQIVEHLFLMMLILRFVSSLTLGGGGFSFLDDDRCRCASTRQSRSKTRKSEIRCRCSIFSFRLSKMMNSLCSSCSPARFVVLFLQFQLRSPWCACFTPSCIATQDFEKTWMFLFVSYFLWLFAVRVSCQCAGRRDLSRSLS